MDKTRSFFIFALSLCFAIVLIEAATQPTTTITPEEECSRLNTSCDACVKAPKAKCYYCLSTKRCSLYPASDILPNKECPLSEARWGTCLINFEALIISMSVIAGMILIGVPCCIYCCCCRGSGNKAKWAREDAKTERQKEERKMKHEQKKAERKAKNDEIRRKYGLLKNEEESDSLYAEDV
ncbi:pituitary tumor-transforming gene 1 protein-interacting protein-like isoform X1 [Diadema antillarum]|uniref:pituitary tumor-transforming gene 1 protein-interacting protein-like isoform X1 n=1 Tax=Diadema antillarum TaxID=105358 RepID=UPI003A89A1A1